MRRRRRSREGNWRLAGGGRTGSALDKRLPVMRATGGGEEWMTSTCSFQTARRFLGGSITVSTRGGGCGGNKASWEADAGLTLTSEMPESSSLQAGVFRKRATLLGLQGGRRQSRWHLQGPRRAQTAWRPALQSFHLTCNLGKHFDEACDSGYTCYAPQRPLT